MEKLLQPFETNGLRFKNRIIHAPTTLNMSDPAGYATRRLAAAYGALARGGYSAVCVGATCVRRDGLINERMLGLYDEDYVLEFRDVVTEIKNHDSLAGIQLFYGGLIPGLGTTIPLEAGKGWIPGTVAWGPSDKYKIGNAEAGVVPTAVYEALVEDFGQAGRRAKEAGFDYLSFHFCHGSLPHTNLSLLSNQGRADKYADHFLFCEEIIKRTQELCGKDFPIIPRMCCDENLEGGFDLEYFADHYAPRLHALGIDALDCTFGSMLLAPSRRQDLHSTEFIGPGFYTPKVVNRDNIKQLRRMLVERGIDMPLIGSANLITPDHLRDMVEDAGADFAAVCRLSLDDPDFPNKMIEGRENEIRKSTHTGASLLQGNIFSKGWAGSAQNPNFGRDDEYRLRPAVQPRRIMVIGGGSGGMEYAITARQMGHDVTLFEAAETLGGAMDWAGNYPRLPNMEMLRYQPDYHRAMMAKHEVPVALGRNVTIEDVAAFAPDVVVLATGAEAVLPDVLRMSDARSAGFVLTIDEVLARSGAAQLGDEVTIWGASEAAELAIDLHREGRTVRIFDPLEQYRPANYIGSRAGWISPLLATEGIQIRHGYQIESVEEGAAVLIGPDGARERIDSGKLIICAGRKPRDEMLGPLRESGFAVQVLGDARKPRSYANAIHEAAYLVRQL